MYPGFQERTKHPNNLCIPCCFGRPRGLSEEAIKQGWSVEEKDKKLFFKNKEGKQVDKNQVPRQAYDGTKNTDLMFKPEGKGPGGAGPGAAGPGGVGFQTSLFNILFGVRYYEA